MRKSQLLVCLAVSLSLSPALFSADPPKKGSRDADFGGMLKAMPLMTALDADRDGSISASEIENAVAALKKLDHNADGVISPDELRPNLRDLAANRLPGGGRPAEKGAPTPMMLTRIFQERDANGDGKLAGEEIPERMKAMLDRVDSNGDGAIDKAEMESSRAKLGDKIGQKKRGNDKAGEGVKPKRPDAN